MAGYIGAASVLGERDLGQRARPRLCCASSGRAPVSGWSRPEEPMSRSGRGFFAIAAAALVLLGPIVIASTAMAQKRPVVGVLSPFVDADSTFLKDLRLGL